MIQAKLYPIIRRAVEEGCLGGIHRAYKHRDDKPNEHDCEDIADVIADEVMRELLDVLYIPPDADVEGAPI